MNPSASPRASTDVEGKRTTYVQDTRNNELSAPTAPQATTTPESKAATPTYERADTPPDNTRVNQRDRNDATLTPMDQGNGSSDLSITQSIRKAVISDKSLSFTAKNVKIITLNGKVTLRGPVNNDHERSAIERAARAVAGVASVDNQLEIKP